jgi:hypothetical protein
LYFLFSVSGPDLGLRDVSRAAVDVGTGRKDRHGGRGGRRAAQDDEPSTAVAESTGRRSQRRSRGRRRWGLDVCWLCEQGDFWGVEAEESGVKGGNILHTCLIVLLLLEGGYEMGAFSSFRLGAEPLHLAKDGEAITDGHLLATLRTS